MFRFAGPHTARATKGFSSRRISAIIEGSIGGSICIQARGCDTRYLCNQYGESTPACRFDSLCRCRTRVCDTCVYRPQQLYILDGRTTYLDLRVWWKRDKKFQENSESTLARVVDSEDESD